MGGKSVVLKSVALCQYLCQYGFGIPAVQARIALKDEIHFCIGDHQSVTEGLSSFAAEMKMTDGLIRASRRGVRLLALLDEPARTTNPTEGTALVSALLQVLCRRGVSLLMATHYVVVGDHNCRCLKVKGFAQGKMDYSLIEVGNGEVPLEALRVAEQLGVDSEWIAAARSCLDVMERK